MYPTGMPALLEHQWPELYKEFEAFGGLLKDFCAHKSLSYTYACKKFTALEKVENEREIAKARKELAKEAVPTAKGLVELTKSADESIRLKAIDNLLNKVGISSQSAVVSVSSGNQTHIDNRVQVQFFIPENNRRVIDAKVVEPKLLGDGEDD